MVNISQRIFAQSSRDDFLELCYKAAIVNHLPIAIWRSPESGKKQLIVDLSDEVERVQVEFDKLSPGFVISPFYSGKEQAAFFVKANVYLQDSGICYRRDPHQNDSVILQNKVRFEKSLFELSNANSRKNPQYNGPLWYTNNFCSHNSKSTSKEDYCLQVDRAVAKIKRAELKKVVLSRELEVELSRDFHPLILFNKLCDAYQNAFVSIIALPGLGTWIGATPELLLSLKDDELTTVALAGTRPVSPKGKIWSKEWNEKEIVEQAIVSEFIRDCFAEQKIANYTEQRTESVQIGDLLHLQTIFNVASLSSNGRKAAEKLLSSLHPTPAVCGVPQREALHFIEKAEQHSREFYAGYLGPINVQNQSQLYVNLRCLQMRRDSAILYAGGGITIDSVPEQEWLETELKLDALLRFLTGESCSYGTFQKANVSKVLCYD